MKYYEKKETKLSKDNLELDKIEKQIEEVSQTNILQNASPSIEYYSEEDEEGEMEQEEQEDEQEEPNENVPTSNINVADDQNIATDVKQTVKDKEESPVKTLSDQINSQDANKKRSSSKKSIIQQIEEIEYKVVHSKTNNRHNAKSESYASASTRNLHSNTDKKAKISQIRHSKKSSLNVGKKSNSLISKTIIL